MKESESQLEEFIRIMADLTLENKARGADHKKALTPARKCKAIDYLVDEERLPRMRQRWKF
jgi:hypothetical protein